MHCHELEQYLEQRTGEPLSHDAAAHLNDCLVCRAVVSDLDAIQEAAGRLDAAVEPPERVWLGLRGQLEAEGLIQTPRKVAWLTEIFAVLPRPALAGVYLSLLLAVAVLLSLRGNLARNQGAQSAETTPAASALHAQLSSVERRTVPAIHQHNPAVTASLRQNLDIVDNFIALCEKTVREEPRNEMAREYLYGAYQQKAELLSAMMDRDAAGER